ncbi:winged helix-turn-helix transcriptional regulator [Kocuria palustris]|jgi:DNA-binding transcriptional ArsR family regulator|uniref:ArsR/SmtB family transcription factor n=1 Tax=Kocuria palustris TaxID=71999 RepID=UPI0006AA2FF9|nr:metalloregulator ArsR/SmtB family transcription factor [Kocuria palustris]MBN6753595.1 winged helix-turn-helix transcriptional regulator [Kocuria palustris]MBN6758521.1 winged helix-turn-helix transcriptional regulator [Kocuria palustris]MBN6763758.1 winged helix-turn-helix transcriptional regulator [Kocuria palustris]MBN6783100.1 winged helix-turn-helix transcriptional regulator [Kocuria palustris]MBN6799618.1 winged helix-turn-helix transcriptional regulator [Kocuria palustris]
MTQDVFTALADPTRRALLEELSIGERAVGELVAAVEASQPTVSKHLRVLRESGLVHQRAVGQKRFYRIEAAPLLETAEALRELVGRQHREAASSASPVETAEPLEPAQSTEPVRIVSQEAPESQEDAQPAAFAEQTPVEQRSPVAQQARFPQQPAASADEAVVGEAALAAAPAASAAQEAAPQRLDPLSAVQDGQSPARGRGVSGLVSSVLRRRRR